MKDAMEKKRTDLKKLLGELDDFQKGVADGKEYTQPEADSIDAKAEEAESLQKEIDAHDHRVARARAALEGGRKVTETPPIPENVDDTKEDVGFKRIGRRQVTFNGKPVGGMMRLGDYVVAKGALQRFAESGMPRAGAVLATVPTVLASKGMREPLVPVLKSELDAMVELKAVPTIGDDVIEPTLIPDFVRVTEQDQLRLRDVLDIGSTTSDAVKYTRLVSYTRAASTVAPSAQKPEAAMEIDTVTEAVRTIAVHIPVEEQQLSDYPALSGIINGELLYDVEKHVEELVMWGDGSGENFHGILTDVAVLDARTEVGDTLIDVARRGITDVRRAGYEPNGILVDPLDWEDIVLEKGNDNRYVWVVVTEGATQRLWAVPVVETVAMEDFQGNATEERNMLIGDFRRGATLWDRQRSTISVGWINDQFIRNQRTILAELRAAFGVKRPGAFRKHETQAAVAS